MIAYPDHEVLGRRTEELALTELRSEVMIGIRMIGSTKQKRNRQVCPARAQFTSCFVVYLPGPTGGPVGDGDGERGWQDKHARFGWRDSLGGSSIVIFMLYDYYATH